MHRSIFPTPETKHLQVAPSWGLGASPSGEGPGCTVMPLHHSSSNAGCKGAGRTSAGKPESHAWRHTSHHELSAAATYGVSCLCQALQWGLCTPHLSDFILPTNPDVGVVFPFPDVAIKALESFRNLLGKYGEGLRFEPRSGNTHQKSQMVLPFCLHNCILKGLSYSYCPTGRTVTCVKMLRGARGGRQGGENDCESTWRTKHAALKRITVHGKTSLSGKKQHTNYTDYSNVRYIFMWSKIGRPTEICLSPVFSWVLW